MFTMDWRKLIVFIVLTDSLVSGYLLPTAVIPLHYNLKITTYLDEPTGPKFSFVGTTKIQILCLEPTTNITLHSLNLAIHKEEVTQLSSQNKLHVDKTLTDNQNEFFVVVLSTPLEKGETYELSLNFEGKLTDGLIGYYRSSYIDKKTKKRRWLAVTNFEPTMARRAFPCFDQPNLKATYEITLGRRKELSSLSNMPLLKSEPMPNKKGWILDTYPKTLRMSSYLVAYAVSDFHSLQSKTKNNVSINIWARPDAINQTMFASGIGKKSLEFFERYFNIAYALPKQDLIALPDFSAGAMENWGLITFREKALLVDENISTIPDLRRVAYVISHELAHQWFGNLVTLTWWSDLWLNEGFATYMGTFCIANIFPQWNIIHNAFTEHMQDVFELDSLKSSHQISLPVYNPADIREIFDTISYKKGSSIIRMMSHFLGPKVFQHGISNYLQKYAYSNAGKDDLWNSLTEVGHKEKTLPSNVTVKQIMDSWILQTGFPVIHIRRNYATGRISITQERYFKDMTIESDPAKSCWWVPLSYTTEDQPNFNNTMPKIWLSCPKYKYYVSGPPANKWIIFNTQTTGVYIVNYDVKTWKQLAKSLKYGNRFVIPEINRFTLIDNSMRLAWTGALSYDIAFYLVTYIKAETAYLPWKAALGNLNKIGGMLSRTSSYGNMKVFMRGTVAPVFKKLGGLEVTKSKRKDFNGVQHQVLIAHAACLYGVDDCVKEAVKLFHERKSKPFAANKISKEMRSVVYCTAISHGRQDDWDFLWKEYKKSNLGTEKTRILSALGCTRKIWLLIRYLEWTLRENSDIRKQDIQTVINSICKSNIGYFVLQTFLENRLNDLANRLHPHEHRLGRILKNIARHVATHSELKRLNELVNNYKTIFSKSKNKVKQATEIAKINVQWYQLNYRHVKKVLEDLRLNHGSLLC